MSSFDSILNTVKQCYFLHIKSLTFVLDYHCRLCEILLPLFAQFSLEIALQLVFICCMRQHGDFVLNMLGVCVFHIC